MPIMTWTCSICRRAFVDLQPATACEARGRPIALPRGCIVVGSLKPYLEHQGPPFRWILQVVESVMPIARTDHDVRTATWAWRDGAYAVSDSVGEDRCDGPWTKGRGVAASDLDELRRTPRYHRAMAYLRANGIPATILLDGLVVDAPEPA